MAWNLRDDEVRATITSGVAPPADPETMLADDTWANIFSMWCTDMGHGTGDYTASAIFALWRDLTYRTEWETVKANYLDEGGAYALEWPDNVRLRFDQLANGMSDDPAGAFGEMWAAALEKLEPYMEAFRGDINDLQSETASEPVATGIAWEDIDRDLVDSINQVTLKELPDAEGLNSFLQYWQLGDLVLLGDNHPAQYLAYVKAHGGGEGQIYMNSKGGFASRGEIIVQGYGSHYEHSDDFKAAIRRFSQKKLNMQ